MRGPGKIRKRRDESIANDAPESSRRSRAAQERRRRRIRWIVLFLLLGGVSLFAYRALRPLPLIDPTFIFPGRGSLTVLEVSRGVLPELDAVIDGAIEELPALLEFRGFSIEIPTAALVALPRSGPWRVAWWEDPTSGDKALFIGGEAFGPARERWLGQIIERTISASSRERMAEVGGALVLANDREVLRSIVARAPEAPVRPIAEHGMRVVREDAGRRMGVDLWFDFSDGSTRLTERWHGEDGAFAWRSRFERYGVDLRLTDETSKTRTWEVHGVRAALRELLDQIDRF